MPGTTHGSTVGNDVVLPQTRCQNAEHLVDVFVRMARPQVVQSDSCETDSCDPGAPDNGESCCSCVHGSCCPPGSQNAVGKAWFSRLSRLSHSINVRGLNQTARSKAGVWSFELRNIPVFLVISGYHRIESIYTGSPPKKKVFKSPKSRVSHNWDCPKRPFQ